ncbi:MAG: cupin domain-containing protein [Collimonas sp.]
MDENAESLSRRLIRNFNTAPTRHDVREPLYDSVGARLGTGTAAQKLGASIDTVAPGKISCPYHFHYAQEEMFIILEGSGTLRVAGEMLPLRSGDVVFIPPGPEYPHQIVNTSDQPLKYLSVSTMEQPEVCEYPDSGKFLAMASVGGERVFDVVQRRSNDLDYWDGEP